MRGAGPLILAGVCLGWGLEGGEPLPAVDAPAAASAAGGVLGDWGGVRPGVEGAGFTPEVCYIGEVMGNVTGGRKRGVVYEGLAKARVGFELGRVTGQPLGCFEVSMLCPHGPSPSERFTGDLLTLSNLDAEDSFRLFELWYEQGLWADRLSLRVGQMAADEEFAFTDTGALFINGTCGWPAFIGLNTRSPAYPTAAPGMRLRVEVTDHLAWQSGLFTGDPEPTDEAGRSLNPHGVSPRFDDGVFGITEWVWTWKEGAEAGGGRCRLGGWWHTGPTDHQRLDDTGRSLADPLSTGRPRSLGANWGLHLTAEAQVWVAPDSGPEPVEGLRVFTRVGGSPGDRNPLQYYAEAGLNYQGLLPHRAQDTCGLALVYGGVSGEARALAADARRFSEETVAVPDYEMLLEATYRAELRAGWTLQPTIQWVIHPGGSSATPNALVLSLRTTLDL